MLRPSSFWGEKENEMGKIIAKIWQSQYTAYDRVFDRYCDDLFIMVVDAVEFGDRYAEHVAKEASMSIYDTGNGYNVDLPMVTLSTCTGHGLLDRMVLVCQPVYETKLDPFIQDLGTVSQNE